MPSAASTKTPLYHRIAASLRRAIDSGRYRPGDRLPDERRLAEEQGVSRATIRQALKVLGNARRIERIQGSGTYVSKDMVKSTYVLLVAVGPTARYSPYVASVLGAAEQSLARRDLRLSVRYLDHSAELPAVILSVKDDPTIFGGILVGYVAEADVRAATAANLPWVMLGDYTETVRGTPVIDQVVGDDYHLSEQAVKALLDQGVRRPALLTYEPDGVWTKDRISAFRSLCDVAGIPSAHQMIGSLVSKSFRIFDSAENFYNAVRTGIATVVRQWISADCFPDGVVLPGPVLSDWLDFVRSTPEASPLRSVRIVAIDFDQQRHIRHVPMGGPAIWWAVMCMSEMTDQALHRLMEQPRGQRPPVRDYIREVAIIPHVSSEE
jgi:DNA-binding LacI/PurR family transcriptional regulator